VSREGPPPSIPTITTPFEWNECISGTMIMEGGEGILLSPTIIQNKHAYKYDASMFFIISTSL
jgi:hypothetical protein